MSKTKNILLAAAAGALSVVMAHYLEEEGSMSAFVSRLVGAAIGISLYFAVFAYFRNKQSK